MLVREKGNKDADVVGMGWDEAQSALRAGTHEVAEAHPDVDLIPAVGIDAGGSAPVDYESMSRTDLDALAAERGVDVSQARNKGDVIAALKA